MSYATRKTPRSSFFGDDAPPVNIKVSPIYVRSPPIIAQVPPITIDGGTIVSTTASAPTQPVSINLLAWGAAALVAYWLFGRS